LIAEAAMGTKVLIMLAIIAAIEFAAFWLNRQQQGGSHAPS
jgi:HAMP domain-containing protein